MQGHGVRSILFDFSRVISYPLRMARPLRIEYPGAVYHVTTRGNDKKAVFNSDEDREMFLSILVQVTTRYHWLCHAYCLMSNHYHLMIETPDGNLSIGMRQLNGVYTQARNKRRHKTGHLFEGRYKAILIQKESHLLEVCRYVVLNPVRAGMVAEPEAWAWSSYGATAGLGQAPLCLTTEWILSQFSPRRGEAEKAYQQFVQGGIRNRSIWRDLKGQVLLGDDGFAARFAEHLLMHKDSPEIPRSQRYADRPSLSTLFTEEVLSNKQMRNRAIAEATEMHGYTQRAIADHLGVHFTYVSTLLKRHRDSAQDA